MTPKARTSLVTALLLALVAATAAVAPTGAAGRDAAMSEELRAIVRSQPLASPLPIARRSMARRSDRWPDRAAPRPGWGWR